MVSVIYISHFTWAIEFYQGITQITLQGHHIFIIAFSHQMVLLFKDPHGEKVFATVTSTHHYSVSGGRDDDIDNLRRRVKELETALALSQVGPGAERNGNATVSYHTLSYRVLRRDQLLLEIRQKAAPNPSSLIPYGVGQLSHHQLLVVVRKH